MSVNPLTLQLAQMKAEQLVEYVLTQIADDADESLTAMLVARHLVKTTLGAVSDAGERETALRKLLAFVVDVSVPLLNQSIVQNRVNRSTAGGSK